MYNTSDTALSKLSSFKALAVLIFFGKEGTVDFSKSFFGAPLFFQKNYMKVRSFLTMEFSKQMGGKRGVASEMTPLM